MVWRHKNNVYGELSGKGVDEILTEPSLQSLTGEQLRCPTANVEDHARLDVAASGLWGSRFGRSLTEVRILILILPQFSLHHVPLRIIDTKERKEGTTKGG